MKPEFWSDLHQNLMQPFPHPNDASDKIWLKSACWSQRYSCLKVWTHRRTHAPTPARVPSYKLTLWAFGSGELTRWLYRRAMHPKDADGMANSADPDQEQSDLGLHCLPRPLCPKTYKWAMSWENLSSEICDQVRLKPDYSATDAD